MQQDADAKIATYYQSPGADGADPAATVQAEQKCHGFWCPWLPNGTAVPSPGPSPFPGPVFTFVSQNGSTPLCLNAVCLATDCDVNVVSCSSPPTTGMLWNFDNSSSRDGGNTELVIRVAQPSQEEEEKEELTQFGNEKNCYLRHHPPKDSCNNSSMRLGERTATVYATYDETTKQIKSSSCAGKCVGITETAEDRFSYQLTAMARLLPCEQAGQWTVVQQ